MRSARALHFAFGSLTWKQKLHKQQTVVTKNGKALLEGRREQRLAYVSEITQHFKAYKWAKATANCLVGRKSNKLSRSLKQQV